MADRMVARVSRAIVEAGLKPQHLTLELTENILMSQIGGALATLAELRQMGVRLAVDDFGTGYSSLSYLKRFPVDRLKVDASFVRDVAVDPDDAAIVTAIVGLAHHLGLRVIAEGERGQRSAARTRRQMQQATAARACGLGECDVQRGRLLVHATRTSTR
jgi:EAL domain-containing protein (putative c-di-GMP-specific phosphodiesterase class I)